MPLTDKQTRFVDEYVVTLNAKQAAINAGYSEHTAKSQGHELLGKPDVEAAIAAAMQARANRCQVDADRVLHELSALAFWDPGEIVATYDLRGPADLVNLPEPVRRAILGWSWDKEGRFCLKFSDKLGALTALGRHLGLFKDRVEHTGKDGGPIETTETMTDRDRARRVALMLARAGRKPKD